MYIVKKISSLEWWKIKGKDVSRFYEHVYTVRKVDTLAPKKKNIYLYIVPREKYPPSSLSLNFRQ